MIPQTFTVTSEHIRFYFSVFLFLHFLVVVSVRQIKLTHVGFRAHVKISSRILSCRKNFRTLLQLASISQYSTVSGHMRIVDTARTACGAESMQRSCVRPSVRPSVPSSTAAAACGGFAAERPAGRTYRSTAAGAQQQLRRSTALSSKCGQCHVDSRGTRLNADLLQKFLRRLKMQVWTRENENSRGRKCNRKQKQR